MIIGFFYVGQVANASGLVRNRMMELDMSKRLKSGATPQDKDADKDADKDIGPETWLLQLSSISIFIIPR